MMYRIMALALLCVLAACSDMPSNTSASFIDGEHSKSAQRLTAAWPLKPDSHYPSHARDCMGPPKNCLNGKHLPLPPKAADQIIALEAAIHNGSQTSFFADPNNYNELWTTEVNRCISDLRNGSAVLVIVPSSSQSFRQYALMNAATGEAMDYSDLN
jgi:hypothetical protein